LTIQVKLDGHEVGKANTPMFDLWRHIGLGFDSWNVPYEVQVPGRFSIVAEAYDLFGRYVGTTETHIITFSLPSAPTVRFIEPEGQGTRLRGSCDPSTYVMLEIDGVRDRYPMPCEGGAKWDDWRRLGPGSHRVVLTTLDRDNRPLANSRTQSIEVP
jgi:hypothetical protein